MKRLFARPRSLLLAVALAVVAAMCTAGTAHAASPGGGAAGIRSAASQSTAASDAPCNFQSDPTCQSTDPAVTVSTYQTGDTSACSFVWNVDWGDGNSASNITVTDPPGGWSVLAQHTYANPGTYTISLTGETTAGNCTLTDFSRTFTFLPPPPPQAYHSVTLFGYVTCRGVGKRPLDVGRVRIQAANGEAHDAKLHLAWTVYVTTYSVTFTHVPQGGEQAYVYVRCGLEELGQILYGTVYGLKGPVQLNGFFGYQLFNIYPGEKP